MDATGVDGDQPAGIDDGVSAAPEASIDALVRQIHSHDAAVRSLALTQLQEMPDVLASIAPRLLQSDSPSVRNLTLTALAATAHPELETWLVRVLEEDPDVNVCAAAVDLLGEVGTGVARASLEALPGRFPDHAYIRFAVRVALERLTDV